jgi:hypothetical protein
VKYFFLAVVLAVGLLVIIAACVAEIFEMYNKEVCDDQESIH